MPRKQNKKVEPRPALNRERVLQAALKLADEQGITALSMRNLAETLGVKAMSLYNHVENKDELFGGIIDLVVAEIELPSVTKEWRGAMRRRAVSAHQALLRHPWASQLMMSHPAPSPVKMRYFDATLGCLRNAGFSVKMADHAWNILDSFIYGFTLQMLAYPFDLSELKSVAAQYLPMLTGYPHMRELTETIVTSDYKDSYDGVYDFEFGLDLILDGLERSLQSKAL